MEKQNEEHHDQIQAKVEEIEQNEQNYQDATQKKDKEHKTTVKNMQDTFANEKNDIL